MTFRAVVLLLALSLSVGTLLSDDFWEKKPAATWSERDANKLLEDSPWANRYAITDAGFQEIGKSVDPNERDITKEIWYRAQFWSAPPLREARVRTMKTQSGYDKLKPADKQSFDERAKQFVDTPFPDTIVVRISYGASIVDWDRKMDAFWATQTIEMQQTQIFLVADGKRIPPIKLQLTQKSSHEFYLIFPRVVDGAPVLAGPSGKLGLELQHPDVSSSGKIQRVWIQFNPAKMLYHGNLVF